LASLSGPIENLRT
jgi:hypothetical protein